MSHLHGVNGPIKESSRHLSVCRIGHVVGGFGMAWTGFLKGRDDVDDVDVDRERENVRLPIRPPVPGRIHDQDLRRCVSAYQGNRVSLTSQHPLLFFTTLYKAIQL